jgi:hypothetical protein
MMQWILDVDGDLVNLNLVADIIVKQNFSSESEDTRWIVLAGRGEIDAVLFASKNKDECKRFINSLADTLGKTVIRI